MVKVTRQILIFVVVGLALLFIGFELGLTISGYQVFALLLGLAVLGAVVWLYLRKSNPLSDIEAAEKVARQFWKRRTNEDLQKVDDSGTGNYIGEIKHFAFRFLRLGGVRANKRVVIVIEHTGGRYAVADWDDNPDTKLWDDPFDRVQGFILRTGAPMKDPPLRYLERAIPSIKGPPLRAPGPEPGSLDDEAQRLQGKK
jgi:hypothetical protein